MPFLALTRAGALHITVIVNTETIAYANGLEDGGTQIVFAAGGVHAGLNPLSTMVAESIETVLRRLRGEPDE